MASRIKGITIEIGGDASGLDKALSGVNSKIKTTQSELRDVDRLLKLDPTNTELLQQKQRLLGNAIGDTKEKLKKLKEAEEQVQDQFEKGEISQEQYDALKREIIQTEQELQKLEKKAEQSNATLAKIGAVADQVANSANNFAAKTKGLSTAAAGALASIGAMALKSALLSDDLNTLAKQTGFSTAELQKMQYAADRIDVEMETITGAAAKLTKNLTSTSAQITEAWDTLGISIRDNNGELRNSTDIFYEVVDALSKVENETERDTLAMTIFGKSANQLAGVIDDGGAALRELGQEAEDLGLVLSQETLDSLNAVNDELDALKAQTTATIAKTGAKALKALTPVIEEVVDALGNLLEFVGNLSEDQIKLGISVLTVVAAISPVAKIVAGIATAIKGVTVALGFLSANPIILLVAGITAMSAAAIAMKKDLESSAEAADHLIKTIEDGGDAFDDTIGSIDATANSAGALIDRLDELNEDGLDAVEAEEYNQILSTLCQTVPELAGLIDLETGAIEGGTEALRANTEAWRRNAKQQAYQERLTDLYKAYSDTLVEQEKNTIYLAEAQAELEAAEQNLIETQERLGDVAHDEAEQNAQRNTELATAQARYDAAAGAVERYSTALEEDAAAIEAATNEIAAEEAAIDSLLAAEENLVEGNAAVVESTDIVTAETDEAASAVEDLAAKYAEAYNNAYDSLSGQIGLFDEFSAELDSDLDSTAEMMAAWAEQAANMAAYTENLRKAAEYGIDEGLVASLADGSAESAAYLDEIITSIEDAGVTTEGLSEDAQTFVDDFNAAFAETEKAKEELAGTLAAIEVDLQSHVGDGYEFGNDLVVGMINGINNKSGSLYATMNKVVLNAIRTAKVAADSHSPSKKTIKLFEDVGEGMVIGMQNKQTDVVSAVYDTVQKALALDPQNAAGNAGIAIGSMTSSMLGGGAVQNNNSRTIQVTVQNTFGDYDSATGNAVASDLMRQINRALGRAY